MKSTNLRSIGIFFILLALSFFNTIYSQDEIEDIDSDSCIDCHELSKHDSNYADDLEHSVHEDFECQDCHSDITVYPHDEDSNLMVGCEGCRSCHEDESDDYSVHGRESVGDCGDIPTCADCHGDHDILPSSAKASTVHPTNLPTTCGACHENLDLIKKHEMLLDHPIAMYSNSVHGKATTGGIYVAATCNDCHSSGGTSHKIYSPGHPESAINHFNIPKTCGNCHKGIENDYWDGIHGKLVAQGETDAPICTDCHGEHGIITPDDSRSPVSAARLAEATCAPCHESTRFNQKYGGPSGEMATFVDSYHGLKSKAGDTHVANCGSCHGVHRILPSTDSTSTIFPANLQSTCGECHPGITETLAGTSIHGVSGNGIPTPVADMVEKIYILAIIIIIGLMALHWLLDLFRQIRNVMKKPQIRRMRHHEVWQHTFLMLSFMVLVVSGFALRFSEAWIARLFFGFEGGFELRGTVHRISAVIFILSTIWHMIFITMSLRGRKFVKDIFPNWTDFVQFFARIKFYLGFKYSKHPHFERFSYVEKAEYWALVWGTAVMIITGLLLWFDNFFTQYLPDGFLNVSLIIHYWEAWLATLAILVWHLYSTVFSPDVYPMNPSWLTGTMPEDMYAHEHPGHLEEAKKEMDDQIKAEMKNLENLHHIDSDEIEKE